jgi:uncharacterized alkaline shock family protein YloU
MTSPDVTPARIGQNELGRIEVEPRRRKPVVGRLPKVSADVDGGLAFLEVELAVCWPAPIGKVTEAVRQHLFQQVRAQLGLEVSEVNIQVVELLTEAAASRVA